MNILVTGGTVFASRYTAEYFRDKGHNVYVLNRGNLPQSEGVTHIKCDRRNLGDTLKCYSFDTILDIATYNEQDLKLLLDALGEFKHYIFISTSAVYPETAPMPFNEEEKMGANKFWGSYCLNKIAAEKLLNKEVPDAYILRPSYLHGKMNILYREAFAFECAEKDRVFCVPEDGSLPMQFFDIKDMCAFMEILLEKLPEQKVYNVGNPKPITINEWVKVCYKVLGKEPKIKYINNETSWLNYFPFANYPCFVDVTKMLELMPKLTPFEEGIRESYEWYKNNKELIKVKPYIEFIEENL